MSERNLWAEPDDAYDRKPLSAESGEVVPPLMPVSDVPEITAAVDGSEWPDFVVPFVQEGNAAEPDPMHSPDSDSDFLGAEGPSAPTETTGSANQPPDNTDPPSGGRGIEGVGEGGDESGSARGID